MRAMNTTVAIICCIAALIVGAAVSGVIFFRQGIAYRQKQAESIMGSAEKEAEKILADADKEAESKKKTALVEAKDEIHKKVLIKRMIILNARKKLFKTK